MKIISYYTFMTCLATSASWAQHRYLVNSTVIRPWSDARFWAAPDNNPNNQYPKNGATAILQTGNLVFSENILLSELRCEAFGGQNVFDLNGHTLDVTGDFRFPFARIEDGTASFGKIVFDQTLILSNADLTVSTLESRSGQFHRGLSMAGGSTYTNNGSFKITGVNNTIGISNFSGNNTFVNAGTFQKDGFAPIIVTVNYTQNSGVTETLRELLQFSSNFTINGGSLRSASTINLFGTSTITAPVTLETTGNGTINFENFADFGPRMESSGEADTNSHVRVKASFIAEEFALSPEAPLLLIGGAQISPQNVTNTGSFIWTGGNLGPFTNDATARGAFAIRSGDLGVNDGGVKPLVDGSFTNQGYLLHESDTLEINRNSTFTNSAGATYEMTGAVIGNGDNADPGLFRNEGTFLKGSLDGTVQNAFIDSRFESSGLLEVASAQLSIRNEATLAGEVKITGDATLAFTDGNNVTFDGASITVSPDATLSMNGTPVGNSASEIIVNGTLTSSALTLPAAVTLSGAGPVQGNLVHAGDIQPAGQGIGNFIIEGNLTQNSESQTSIAINPTSRDMVAVSGTAALSGTLNLSAIDRENIPLGMDFPILTAGAVTGEFTVVSSFPEVWVVTYTDTQVLVRLESLFPIYETWVVENFGIEMDPNIIGPEADPDGDGVPNAFEFIQGTSPQEASVFDMEFSVVPDASEPGRGQILVRLPLSGNSSGLTFDLMDLKNLEDPDDDVKIETLQSISSSNGAAESISLTSEPFDLIQKSFYRIRLSFD